MKKTIHFWQSINFKIAVAFILLLLISFEIIGNYFINSLEQSNVSNFETSLNTKSEQFATSIGDILGNTQISAAQQNTEIQKEINSFEMTDVLEIRIVDDKGIIRGGSGENQGQVGKKNDYKYLNDFSLKREETFENNSKIYVVVQPIQTNAGNSVIGAIYFKSDIEKVHEATSNISFIFLSASLIAAIIAIILSILIARSITKPIEEMRRAALAIASRDYTKKVQIYGHDELSQLGETFNQLSKRIQQSQEGMESERNRLDSVLSHMNDGVLATDRRGKVTVINEMALSQLDLVQEDAIDQDVLDLLGIEKNYTFREILEDNPNILIEIRDGEDITVLRVDFSVIKRETGFISGLVVVLHDVTEQEKTDRERQEFVSNVSHELRTPLTSMRSYLEALQDGAWKEEEIAPNFINVSLEEANRMIRMINDLLNLSRMDEGRIKLEKEFVNFTDLMNFVLNRFDMILKDETHESKDFKIKRYFTNRALWVEIDEDKMIQVIDNIMNNALKYSPDGGSITVKLVETHNNIILSISDQGLGIPKKDLSKVFDRFYRVDKARSRAQGGTGLGLSIAKEVVTSHGGRIWAESREGRGSTFFIALPFEPFEEEGWED